MVGASSSDQSKYIAVLFTLERILQKSWDLLEEDNLKYVLKYVGSRHCIVEK